MPMMLAAVREQLQVKRCKQLLVLAKLLIDPTQTGVLPSADACFTNALIQLVVRGQLGNHMARNLCNWLNVTQIGENRDLIRRRLEKKRTKRRKGGAYQSLRPQEDSHAA